MDILAQIPPEELKWSCKDPNPPGGQHVGPGYQGVTVEHLPSGITVTVDADRSQHRNRLIAMDALLGAITSPHYRGGR
jgi:protein subunit release factor A